MNKKLKALARICTAIACAVAVCSVNTIVYADDSVDNLEQQTSSLQSELDSLNAELNNLSSEITDLASKIEEINVSVQKAELDLAAAKVSEEMQYNAMKKRIKYMYEAGNASLLHILFSSKSMGDFLNNTEFVNNVVDYDRNMLDKLDQIHKDVEEKDAALRTEQASLEELKAQLDSRQTSLNNTIASTSGELAASSDALAKAKEAQAAAAAALKQEQEAAVQESQNTADSGSSGDSGNNSGSGGGSGTVTVPPTEAETTDLVLFAAILQCEAGTSDYDALLAVATIIMNRVSSGSYPNTLKGVIYQSGQFSPTWNGSLNRVLSNGPASLCYQVAQDALNGARLSSVSGCYSFRSSWTGHDGIIVGGNVFF